MLKNIRPEVKLVAKVVVVRLVVPIAAVVAAEIIVRKMDQKA